MLVQLSIGMKPKPEICFWYQASSLCATSISRLAVAKIRALDRKVEMDLENLVLQHQAEK